MEHDLPTSDGRIVHQELTAELGKEVASPTDPLGALFQRAIADRDAASLRSLVIDQYPTVVWGSQFNQLSDEDRSWAMQAIRD